MAPLCRAAATGQACAHEAFHPRPPRLALADESSGVGRRGLILILGGTAVFCVLVAVAVFALLGRQEKTARHGTERFASALVHGDPAAAPDGADGYVRGIRAYLLAVDPKLRCVQAAHGDVTKLQRCTQ